MPFTMQAVGRLAHEPALTLGRNGPFVEFRLLDSRRTRDGEVTEAVTFIAYDALAEEVCERLEMGQLVHAWGSQATDRWQDQQGKDQMRVRFRLFHFEPGPRSSRSRAAAGDNTEEGGSARFRRDQQPAGRPVRQGAPRDRREYGPPLDERPQGRGRGEPDFF